MIAIVEKYSEEHGGSIEEAAALLYDRSVLGEVRFVDPNPPRNAVEYLVSLYSAWFWVVVAGLASMILVIYVLPDQALKIQLPIRQ